MADVLKALTAFFQTREAEGVSVVPWHDKLETQVIVPKDFEPAPDRPNAFIATKGDIVFPFRIPRNASTIPEFKSFNLDSPLIEWAEGIGSTGWNWRDGITEECAFDFDSIAGHAAGIGVDDEELTRVREAAFGLDYVEVRHSTGGRGYHLRVHFVTEGGLCVRTANHNEHAAAARCVLGKMSLDACFSFMRSVDCVGGNFWHWHRKVTKENRGLTLVKAATRKLTIDDLPPNWRAHVEVVTGKRSKVRVPGLPDEPIDGLTELRQTVPLDETHRALLGALMKTPYATVWEPDHHVIHTHTCALSQVMAEHRESLDLKGYFATNSGGTDPAHPNCFCVPFPEGAFGVFRFGKGTREAATWRLTRKGWTTCDFNVAADLATVAGMLDGCEDPDGQGFLFDKLEQAAAAAELLGEKVEVPDTWRGRPTTLRAHKDGRLIIEVTRESTDAAVKGWKPKRGKWSRVFSVRAVPQPSEAGPKDYDNIVRAVLTPSTELAGYYIRSSGRWVSAKESVAKNVLQHYGRSPAEANKTLGGAAANGWWLVNLPFHDEFPGFPGDRLWNRNAPQLRVQPAVLSADEPPHHPGWDDVLSHLGSDLDAVLAEDEWAIRHGVKSGGAYLRLWIACLVRYPFARLPYLFFWGEQNCGKSFFHEAIKESLICGGVVQADDALKQTFNGELANAVLCCIEETDLSDQASAVYDKIKNWTTALDISIHEKFVTPYSQKNATHWVQTANKLEACPIFKGDTRINVIHVPQLKSEIPKEALIEKLRAEAPHFLRTLMDLELPEPTGRLRLPVIETDSKDEAMAANQNPLDVYLAENTKHADGYSIALKEMRRRFCEPMSAAEADKKYPPNTFGRRLPPHLRAVKGKVGEDGDMHVGNIAWADEDTGEVKPKLYLDKKTKRLKADRTHTGMAA